MSFRKIVGTKHTEKLTNRHTSNTSIEEYTAETF